MIDIKRVKQYFCTQNQYEKKLLPKSKALTVQAAGEDTEEQ